MELPELKKIVDGALNARTFALATYSEFPVGAALLGNTGRLYSGCNVESSSFGLTMCAERVALYKALSEGEREFKAIAVATTVEAFCPPCGACRQVLWDFAKDLIVLLVSNSGNYEQHHLSDFFPHAFDDGFLPHG